MRPRSECRVTLPRCPGSGAVRPSPPGGPGEPLAVPSRPPVFPPQRLHHRAGLGLHRGHRLQHRAASQHHTLQGGWAGPVSRARWWGVVGAALGVHSGMAESPGVSQGHLLLSSPSGLSLPSSPVPGSLTGGFALRSCVHESCS